MRAGTAYLAAAAAVAIAIVAGLSGGLLIAAVMNPKAGSQITAVTRVDQRASAAPMQASGAVPYVVPTMAFADAAAAAAAPGRAQPLPRPDAGKAAPSRAQPAQTTVSNDQAARPDASASKAEALAAQRATDSQAAALEHAMAKSRDADMKRAAERRRIEHRQRWADRRRYRQPRDEQSGWSDRENQSGSYWQEPSNVPRNNWFGSD